MKKLIAFAVAGACILAAQAPKAAARKGNDGWISLFDGKSLKGWQPEGPGKWSVAGGVIVAGQTDDGWLRSDRTYTDFALKLDYRNVPNGNSGIFLRAPKESKPGEACNPAAGYEVQINNEDPNWATGSIENAIQRLVAVKPAPGQWHTFEIEARGDHIVALLDGQKVLDGRDNRFASGYIGLQHHKDSKIEFRNIAVKPLK